MRAKSVLLLMLALGCGLVASIGITQVMAKRDSGSATSSAEMDAIFVAMEDIPMGEPITAQMIKLEEWPQGKIPPGALGNIEDVENRRPKARIYQGSPILDNHLLSQGVSEGGASGQIPKGYRMVSVRVDDVSGGSSMIRPSDRVDVLVHLTRNSSKEIVETTTRTILQDIKVFAVNEVYDLDTSGSTSTTTARTISLLVTPAQAEKVMLATELGKIRLVMRSPEDDEEVDTGGSFPSELYGGTESAERDKESPPIMFQDQLAGSNDFLEFLKSQQPGAQPVVEVPDTPDNWTMRKIEGGDVTNEVLQMDSSNSLVKSSSSGSSLWKMITSSARSATGAVEPDEDQLAPEEDELKPEEKTEDEGKLEED